MRSSNWYAWLEEKLKASPLFDEVVLRDMPDPMRARRNIWLAFMLKELGADARTVVIGHSSGAVAAMRLLETHELYGVVLISACHSDLGDEGERAAGYYPPSGGPWKWEAMMRNSGGNIRLLHSTNDPLIPLDEAQHVAKMLGPPARLVVVAGASHFFDPHKEIVKAAEAIAKHARPAAAEPSAAAAPTLALPNLPPNLPPRHPPPITLGGPRRRVIIIPGNGGSGDNVLEKGWYSWLRDELDEEDAIEVVLRDMPDPIEAKRYIWAPFIESLGLDEHTLLVGHSSGAVCAMRLAEAHTLLGLVLVSAYHTTLGDVSEEMSGYFPPVGGPWQWDRIRANTRGNVAVLNSSVRARSWTLSKSVQHAFLTRLSTRVEAG